MEYKEYIKPELLILIPVLYFIGICIKDSKRIDDRFIPALLGFCGIVFAMFWTIGTEGFCFLSVFTGITQGLLCAGMSVYANQIVKQARKD